MSETEPPERSAARLGVVILAAGQGTRMRSALPKILHPVAGRPMVEHVIRLASQLGAAQTVLVVGPQRHRLRESCPDVTFAVQDPPLGTGHAVLQAREALAGRCDTVVVLYGDTPLLRAETAWRLVAAARVAPAALLTAVLPDPHGYGRVVRDEAGRVLAVVEDAEASAEERAVDEINSGLMAFRAEWLWPRLDRLEPRSKGEYYLTDLVQLAVAEGGTVEAVRADDPTETLGVNDQRQLAEATRIVFERRREALMQAGVVLVDPATTYVDLDVEVGPETILEPNTHLRGRTRIGRRCRVGPNTLIEHSTVGDDCRVWFSVLESSWLDDEVVVGPFSHTRPGARLGRGVHLGNYAEVKASRLGAGTQVHHFSYLGDATIGERVNVGAGTITCNYDGVAKHRTVVGDDAFIGSDTMLVAPVEVGPGARTGAGSVVTRPVAAGATVVGVPARPVPPGGGPGGQPPAGRE